MKELTGKIKSIAVKYVLAVLIALVMLAGKEAFGKSRNGAVIIKTKL